MDFRSIILSVLGIVFAVVPGRALAADLDEFKVKRQEVFEFSEKPKVTRDATSQPDRFVITFASEA